jgi:predicted amidophosphoribosyltransferase
VATNCPKCQSENPDTKQFCGDCGAQLPSFEKIEVTETMETPKEELTTGSTFAGRYQIVPKNVCWMYDLNKEKGNTYILIVKDRKFQFDNFQSDKIIAISN